MKAEQRKELETNVLADRMGKIVQTVKGGPNRRAVFWVVVLAVAAIALFFYFRVRTTQRSEQAVGWFHLGMGRSGFSDQQRKLHLEETIRVGKGPSRLAAIMESAWLEIDNASLSLRREPRIALQRFALLAEELEPLLKDLKDQPVLQAEAQYQLCVIQESRAILDEEKVRDLKVPEVWKRIDKYDIRLNAKFLETARSLYEDVVKTHKDTPYAAMAAKRLEIFNDPTGFDDVRAVYRNLAINTNLEETLRDFEFRIRAEKLKKKDALDID